MKKYDPVVKRHVLFKEKKAGCALCPPAPSAAGEKRDRESSQSSADSQCESL